MKFAVRVIAIALLFACQTHLGRAQTAPLIVNPSSVIFCGKPGQAVSSVPVAVSVSSGSMMFIPTSVTSNGNWLVAEPVFATATTVASPQLMLGLSGGVIAMATGTYTGQVILGGFDGARLATIPVSLEVSRQGCGNTRTGSMFVDSGPLTFEMPPNTKLNYLMQLFDTFPVNITVAHLFTTSAPQNWMTLGNQNVFAISGIQYPGPLGMTIDTTGLNTGSYTGNLELDASNDSILNLPVTLSVDPALQTAEFAVSPSPLSIAIPTGTISTTADIQITNLTKSAFSIQASATSGGNWLSVTPASLSIDPNAAVTLSATISGAGLKRGVNQGSIRVQLSSGSTASFVIPVTANLGIESPISASPNPVSIATPPGASAPVTQTLTISSDSDLVSFSSSTFSSVYQPWLSVAPVNSLAAPGRPATLTVTVQPSLLPAGPAIGVITLKPGGRAAPLVIPVNVNSPTDTSLTVGPARLSFAFQPGGALPQAQTLRLTTSAPNTYTAQVNAVSGGNWLILSATTVATASAGINLTAQVNPNGLAANTYQAQIVLTNAATGAQQVVPVTLTVGPPLSISASPAALAFQYRVGAPLPLAQPVALSSNGGNASIAVASSGVNGAPNFLTLNTSTATTPATLSVGLNAAVVATLPAGQYNAIVTVASPGGSAVNSMVSVTLAVSPSGPELRSVVNSASLQPGPVSPGELVTLFGANLGPADGIPFSFTAQNTVPLQLGDVTIDFDGIAAPLLYVGAGQINTIVPYELAGRTQVNVTVTRGGTSSQPLAVPVTDTAPAIFVATQTGNGQGAILNADSTYNGPNNPAAPGSVVQIFATGEGAYPGALTGSITSATPPFRLFPTSLSVSIGGQPARIIFDGEAPGEIAGILQVNAQVPVGLDPGPQPVTLTIGQQSNKLQSVVLFVQ